MRQHAAGDDAGVEAVLHQQACRGVGALTGAADDVDLPVAGQLVEAGAQLTEGDVDRSGHLLDGELGLLAHVEDEPVAE